MSDRIRIGELLAAIGTIGLVVSLTALDWFDSRIAGTARDSTGGGLHFQGRLLFDAGTIGWFAFLVTVLALVGNIVFFLRLLTSRTVERPTLQAPYAYVASGFAFLTLLVRLFIFKPGPDVGSIKARLSDGQQLVAYHGTMSLHAGAWVGFVSVALMMLGLWFAMADERTGSKAAKARTAKLLAGVQPRVVEHVPAAADPDASVVVDDAVGTDPSSPSSPASGGPA